MSYRLQIRENEQAIITVPKKLREAKGWEDKQELEWELDNNGDLKLTEAEE